MVDRLNMSFVAPLRLLFVGPVLLVSGCRIENSQQESEHSVPFEIKRFTDKEISPQFLARFLRQDKPLSCEELCAWNFTGALDVIEVTECDLKLQEDALQRVSQSASDIGLGEFSCVVKVKNRSEQ